MNQVESAAEELIRSYSNQFIEKGFNVSSIEKRQYNFEIVVHKNNEAVKVQTYFGKKGVKTILQGNKDSGVYKDIYEKIFGGKLFTIETAELVEPENYIGTDESGKGDYFGPLVIAGVYAEKNAIQKLKEIGVRDSKEISHSQIRNLATNIKRIVGDKFNIIAINPEKYNDLYSRIKNVNKLLAWGHAKVIENILEKHSAEEAISDKFGDEKLILNMLQTKGKGIKLHQFTKAERYTAVAAASILARDKFNKWFEEESIKLKINLPKGASTLVEQTATKIRKDFGDNILPKLVKLHFKTTNKIKTHIDK